VAVINHLDSLAPSAMEAGAVNTVVAEDGGLVGHNTDVAGLEGALRGVRLRGRRALVVGAGGAARAACALLKREGASISILNRDRTKAEKLAEEFGGEAVDHAGGYGLIINCTPLGMKGFPSTLPVPRSCIRKGMDVMDTVYNPMMTPLLSIAKEKGANVHSGLEMLIHQGAEAFRLWTDVEPNIDVMRNSIRGMLE
jgi:shikimate dehydrogenase